MEAPREAAGETSTRPATALERLRRSHLPFLGGSLLAGFLAGLPLLRPQWMTGHDALVYVPRSVEFYEVLRTGTWLPRWASSLGFGHGEPIFIFNPPLVYYLTSAFRAVGFDFVAAENLASLALLLVAGVGMYLLASEFFGRRGGLVSATAYVFAPYLLSRLYVSHALADYSSFAFMPLAFWGLYRFCEGGRYGFLITGTLAVALIFLSSSAVALMVFPALILLVVWIWWRARRSLRVVARGAWCLALALGLSTFFWLPSLVETEFVHIGRRAERLHYDDHFVQWWQLIHSPWGFGTSQAGAGDGMSFAVGPLYLLAVAVAAGLFGFIRRASPRAAVAVAFFLAMAGVSALMTTSISRPLWDAVSALHPLQFPFRFLQLIALSTAFLLGAPILLLAARRRLATATMVVLIGGLLVLGLPHARPQGYLDLTDADFSPQQIAERGIAASAREFEPIWVQEFPTKPAVQPELRFAGGSGHASLVSSSPTRQAFVVDASEDSLLESSTFYFPGWTLHVNGRERALAPSSPHGFMQFYLEAGTHAVELRLWETAVRAWSQRVSLLSLVLLVLTPSTLGRPLPGGKVRD